MSGGFGSRSLWLAVLVAAGLTVRSDAASVTGVIVGAEYRNWKEKALVGEDATISQGGGLLTVGLRLSSIADLVVSNAGASSKVGGAADVSLSGLGSISAALQLRLAKDRLLVRLTATPPSGKRELDASEVQVVEAIGHPLLGFGVRHYGTGFEGGGTAAWGLIEAPGYRVSIGAGGLARGSYRLFQSSDEFHPASEWAATGGLDLGTSSEHSRAPFRFDLTYRGFGTDRLGDVEVFREGAQIELQSEGRADHGSFHWSGVLRGVLKSDNATLEPAGSTVASYKASSGNYAAILLAVDHEAGSSGRLGLVIEDDLVSGSDALGRNGNVMGVGPQGRLDLSGGMSLDATAQYWWGRVDADAGDRHDISGLSFRCTLRWSGR